MKRNNLRVQMFFRRNAVYLILAFCILAVSLSIVLMATKEKQDKTVVENDTPVIENPDDTPIQPDQPVIVEVNFILPVSNATKIDDYSEAMVWNSSLGRYSAHKAMDFFADEGTDVLAVYGGTVKSVESSLLQGVTVIIDHGDGLLTKYNSLADGDKVSVGQTVEQGQVIGQVSLSNRQEQASGAHLHFEVLEDGVVIDPTKYLSLSEK